MLALLMLVGIIVAILAWAAVTTPPRRWAERDRRRDRDLG
jgi:hypothetical protein